MIPVSDLRKWADEHAIGRSPSYPRGWVSAKDLREVCREKYGDDFVKMYDMLNSGIPIGNLEETQIFLAMVKAAEEGE